MISRLLKFTRADACLCLATSVLESTGVSARQNGCGSDRICFEGLWKWMGRGVVLIAWPPKQTLLGRALVSLKFLPHKDFRSVAASFEQAKAQEVKASGSEMPLCLPRAQGEPFPCAGGPVTLECASPAEQHGCSSLQNSLEGSFTASWVSCSEFQLSPRELKLQTSPPPAPVPLPLPTPRFT